MDEVMGRGMLEVLMGENPTSTVQCMPFAGVVNISPTVCYMLGRSWSWAVAMRRGDVSTYYTIGSELGVYK